MGKRVKVVIIGAVAAGTSAAAKIRRESEDAEIVIYEKDNYISYGTCGLPYFVSRKIKNINRLIVNTVNNFETRFNLKVKTLHQVVKIYPEEKQVRVMDLTTGKIFNDYFDRLIITSGSKPVMLKFNNSNVLPQNMFFLKTICDAINLMKYMDEIDKNKKGKKNAIIIGGGFIGLELLEAFLYRGYRVSIIEKTSQLLPMFDKEIIDYLVNYLKENKVNIYVNDEVKNLILDRIGKVKSLETLNHGILETDIVFLGVGVKPDVELAQECGVKIGESGSIKVNEYMETNFKNIYAAGDCCECKNLLSEDARSYNLASIAVRQGRIAGCNVLGGRESFSGSLVNSIIKILDVSIAKAGISFKEASKLDADSDFIEFHDLSHAGYYPGADMIHMIIIFNKKTGRILGFQAIGKSGIDKRTDIISTAIKGNLKIWELSDLDLGYQPAYGSARDPVNMLGMIAGNLKKGNISFISINELKDKIKNKENISILDVRTRKEYEKGYIDSAVLVPVNELRNNISKIKLESEIIIYCETGYRAYLGFRILKNLGFKNVKVLNGSYLSWARKI